MNHTPQIKKAIQFAARKHHGQFRIETEPLPYVTHLFSVALLVAEDGAHDDVVTAALLHDTVEDTGTTKEEIALAFNTRVAELVDAVSEVKEKDGKKLEWEEKKQDYLNRLENAPLDAVIVAAADKIDNIESKLEAYAVEGEALLGKWKQGIESYLWYHSEVLRIAQARIPEHRLTKRLAEAHAREKDTFAGI